MSKSPLKFSVRLYKTEQRAPLKTRSVSCLTARKSDTGRVSGRDRTASRLEDELPRILEKMNRQELENKGNQVDKLFWRILLRMDKKHVSLDLVCSDWASLGCQREIRDARAFLDNRARHHRIDPRRRRGSHVFALDQ